MRSYFSVSARWLLRREDTSALALRLADYFSDLATVDLLFERWERCGLRNRSIVPLFSGYAPPEDPLSRMFQAGSAVYLAPELADKITFSEDLKITTQANGGIVMMAAAELFDPKNPGHRAAARQIEVALAPLNYPKRSRPPTENPAP